MENKKKKFDHIKISGYESISEHENMTDLIVLSLQMVGLNPFDKLVELCKPITYSTIKKYFFPDYEREDFLQEARSVLVKSFQDWRIDRGMPFAQYYHMQLNNHLNMLVRKNHAQKRIVNLHTSSLDCLVEGVGIHVQGIADSLTHPEELAIARETMGDYLPRLSKLELKVFKLYLQGSSYDDISEELKITIEQTQNALYRCRVKLSQMVQQG